MTGDQLKRWRVNRNLTQDDLAQHLGWTRDMIANREAGRASFTEDITAPLAALDTILEQRKASAGQPAKPPRFDYSKHRCWDLRGQPITYDHAKAQPWPYSFYRLAGSKARDSITGDLMATLNIMDKRTPQGADTYVQLNLDTWELRCFYPDHPEHVRLLPELKRLLGDGRPSEQAQPKPFNFERTTNAD